MEHPKNAERRENDFNDPFTDQLFPAELKRLQGVLSASKNVAVNVRRECVNAALELVLTNNITAHRPATNGSQISK
jgi:hypothetical protein